jgi:hypothetical protein
MCAATADNGTIALSKLELKFGMVRPDKPRPRNANAKGHSPQYGLFDKPIKGRVPDLPTEDNTPEGLRALLQANAYYPPSAVALALPTHNAPTSIG